MQDRALTFVIFSLFFISSALAQTPEEMKLPDTLSGIPKASGQPVIDGDLGEWSLSAAIFASDKSHIPPNLVVKLIDKSLYRTGANLVSFDHHL